MWRDDWREKLSEYRQGIDEVDFKVLELIDRRMKLSERIGEIKGERNTSYRNKAELGNKIQAKSKVC